MALSGIGRVALLALIWGSGFLWIKLALRAFTPVQLTLVRLALGAAVLLLILWRRRTPIPRDRALWRHLAVAAALGNAVPYLLFGVAEQHIASNLAGAINATTPLWTIALALFTRTERSLSTARAIGLLCGFAGALIMLAPWQSGQASPLGTLTSLAASASYGASYVYMARYLTGRDLPPILLSACQLTAATGLLVLATPFGGLAPPHWRLDATASLLVLGLIGTGAAYVLNYRIITDDGPVLASTVTYLLPVVAVFLGWATLDEPITARILLGVLVVLAGVALTRRAAGQPPTARTAERA